MSGIIAVDAGQSSIRLRFRAPDQTRESQTSGVLTDRPLMPQLAAAIIAFAAEHQLRPDQVGVGCSGLVAPDATELLELLTPLGVSRVALAHDSATSFLGALGDHHGVVVAAGTGVVTLAVGPSASARVDGWGHLLGDFGSAFWIGQAGLRAAMRAFDGRGETTALLERMLRYFPEPASAYRELQADPRRVSRIAAFAHDVDQAAATGDVAAYRILADCAAELSESALTGLRRVQLMGLTPPAVCVLGEVFTSARIRSSFLAYLRLHWRSLELTEPAGTAVDGAEALLTVSPNSQLSRLVSVVTRD
ncbi:MAG TPA: BadF/BadG/BcrA/BcrD ATPase family protein [Propionicimonas sp.]|nr:BadF/BadG/BcrA/BcrD ATPase family protein [Propionicimonas sp.]